MIQNFGPLPCPRRGSGEVNALASAVPWVTLRHEMPVGRALFERRRRCEPSSLLLVSERERFRVRRRLQAGRADSSSGRTSMRGISTWPFTSTAPARRRWRGRSPSSVQRMPPMVHALSDPDRTMGGLGASLRDLKPGRRVQGTHISMRARLLISMALLVVGLAACGSTSHLSEQVSSQPALGSRPVLVVQSPEGESWVRLLRSGG